MIRTSRKSASVLGDVICKPSTRIVIELEYVRQHLMAWATKQTSPDTAQRKDQMTIVPGQQQLMLNAALSDPPVFLR
ncbi:MAG: hypothetical protein Q8S20_17005 [Sulfuritalea sp.]|nr:hypothetical protein [Sulfuritalea sp.]